MTKEKRSDSMTRKNRQPLTSVVFLAGVGVGTLSVCFFFLLIVLIDRL
jgi:hypothetical protein